MNIKLKSAVVVAEPHIKAVSDTLLLFKFTDFIYEPNCNNH